MITERANAFKTLQQDALLSLQEAQTNNQEVQKERSRARILVKAHGPKMRRRIQDASSRLAEAQVLVAIRNEIAGLTYQSTGIGVFYKINGTLPSGNEIEISHTTTRVASEGKRFRNRYEDNFSGFIDGDPMSETEAARMGERYQPELAILEDLTLVDKPIYREVKPMKEA